MLHIGDHDPSGVSIFLAFLEDVEAFTRELGGSAIFTRLAVTPQQIGEYRLPTAPPKATDRRAFAGETCQAEALPPNGSPISCAPPSNAALISVCLIMCCSRNGASAAN